MDARPALPNDSVETGLSAADDRVLLSEWLPPQEGVVPRIRIGRRWINVLWVIPLIVVLLVLGIAVAQELRTLPGVQRFIARYPGVTPASSAVYTGFPLWLRLLHFFNFLFMMFIIRAGIDPRRSSASLLAAGLHARHRLVPLPARRPERPGVDVERNLGRISWLGIPGIRHSIGLARWWHFSFDLLWVINGIAFYVLLFTTDQWQRLVPNTWAVFPSAVSIALQYLSLHFPADHSWTNYNSLQQLAYFLTIFAAAPLAVVTGLMQGPAITNRLGWFARVLNRQAARTIHFGVLWWFLIFIFIHETLVLITGARANLNYMWAGVNNSSWDGVLIFGAALIVAIVAWCLASPFTIRHARLVQRIGQAVVGPLMAFGEWGSPKTQYTEQDISPHFWVNGTLPNSEEFNALLKGGFADYRLRVSGLVEHPQDFSYARLKAMPKHEQITEHFCIQGWSGVAKWAGVRMRDILAIVKPTPEARYVVFYSFSEGSAGGSYYDVHKLHNMEHELTILAYEMNGEPVSMLHGAPLRLRCENELGFKMVKWIQTIEFVADFADLGAGNGGYNEDHEFYGYRMPI